MALASGAPVGSVAVPFTVKFPEPDTAVFSSRRVRPSNSLVRSIETLAFAVTIPDTAAAFPAGELAKRASAAGLRAQPAESVGQALEAILARAPKAPLRVLICGSLYLAGAVLRENG